jgi:phosphate transport system substrate-binding protein
MRQKFLFLSLVLLILYSCDRRKITRTDTETSGFAVIAADECFAPIMKEELDVFTGLNPEAKFSPLYIGEKDLFHLLVTDSVRLIIAARDLSESEKFTIEEQKLTIRSQKIARDGIALIINKSNPDSMINIASLKKIMNGKISHWNELSSGHSTLGEIKVVFDHPNSSTLRFIHETILDGEDHSPLVKALDSNTDVIEYVARTPNALGIIGVSWISNPDDSTKLSFNETIRVMAVGREEEIREETTYKPYPAYLNNDSYPLTRDVFIILTDLRGTLPAGFVKFMAGDAGQRIILKAGLVPATRPKREIYLKNDF